MATYTTFDRAALERYLVMFDLGELDDYSAISEGIENSNYFVQFKDADQEFVLTITEGLGFDEVPFFNDLLQCLVNAGLPVPEPQRTLDGMPSTIFRNKPTWLFNRLPGIHPIEPSDKQCEQIGEALARIHAEAGRARYTRPNVYDATWARESLQTTGEQLELSDQQLLTHSLRQYEKSATVSLPRGTVHGDLFRDNALFDGDNLTGVIDFYHACEDFFIQDIAITINDWCCTPEADDEALITALLAGYESIRTLLPEERGSLTRFRAFGAMRFALTRLLGGRLDTAEKNPREFLDLLHRLTDTD